MNVELIWILTNICLAIGLIAGALFWFLVPKKWIVWSEKAADILPQETPAPWASLNTYGKALYVVFIASVLLMFVLLFIGYLIEQSYL